MVIIFIKGKKEQIMFVIKTSAFLNENVYTLFVIELLSSSFHMKLNLLTNLYLKETLYSAMYSVETIFRAHLVSNGLMIFFFKYSSSCFYMMADRKLV